MASTGVAESKQDDKKGGKDEKKAEDDDDNDEVVAEDTGTEHGITEQALKLHRYLGKVETPSIRTDYELTKRKWKLNIGRVSFVNHNDTKMSVFLAFAVTDRRPPSKSAQQFYTMCGGNAATMSELNTTVKYTPCIRNVQPQQQVNFPGVLEFTDWGYLAGMRMTYRDIIKRDLRVEVWERRDYGANVLLGTKMLTFSTVLQKTPDMTVYVTRNVAPTTKGRSMNVGAVAFAAVLEEANLQHRLRLNHWSICLSNQLAHKTFKHPSSVHCTWPCMCSVATCCCSGVEDTLQLWGFGERVEVSVSLVGGNVVVNDKITRRKSVLLTAPMHSTGMRSAAATLDSPPVDALSPDLSVPHNESTSYSVLMEARQNEALTIDCSKSALEDKMLDVKVRMVCRRCFSEGVGAAVVPLRGVTSASFLPISVPIVFKRVVNSFGCSVNVTAGVLRGYVLWNIHGAPLMHHFTQPSGGMSLAKEGSGLLSKRMPSLAITLKSIRDLPMVHRDGGVNPRITIAWGGSTQTGRSTLRAANMDFKQETKLVFPFPKLAGKDSSGTLVGPDDLLEPLMVHRFALIRVWDDPSYADLDDVGGVTYMTKRTEMIAEALVEIPFDKLLGVVPSNVAAARKAAEADCRTCCNNVRKALAPGADRDIAPQLLKVALAVPGADVRRTPKVELMVSLENLPLKDSAICAMPPRPTDLISIIPDFAPQVAVDPLTANTEGEVRFVTAPGELLSNREYTERPISHTEQMLRVGKSDNDNEGEEDEEVSTRKVEELTPPNCIDPVADLSHSIWWSTVVRMVRMSAEKHASLWWRYTSPNTRGRHNLQALTMGEGDLASGTHDGDDLKRFAYHRNPSMLMGYVSEMLYVIDESGIRRCLPSVLTPLPVQGLLHDFDRQIQELEGAAFDSDEVTSDVLRKSDNPNAKNKTKGTSVSSKFMGTQELNLTHLAHRACIMAATFEFTDSVEDVKKIRAKRNLIADPPYESKELMEKHMDYADPTRIFASLVCNTLQNRYWMSPAAFLSLRRGGVAEHAAFLCSAMLGIGLDAYLAIGLIEKRDDKAIEAIEEYYNERIAALQAAKTAVVPGQKAVKTGGLLQPPAKNRKEELTNQVVKKAKQLPKHVKVSFRGSKYDPATFAPEADAKVPVLVGKPLVTPAAAPADAPVAGQNNAAAADRDAVDDAEDAPRVAPQLSLQEQINSLEARKDTAIQLLSEAVHYFVVVFSPPRVPGKVENIEPEVVTVYDVDGRSRQLRGPRATDDAAADPTMINYKRVMLLANHRNVWMNNQSDIHTPKEILLDAASAVAADTQPQYVKKDGSEVLSRPTLIESTQFNLQQPNMWICLFNEVASTAGAKGGSVAYEGGAAGDALIETSDAASQPMLNLQAPGLGKFHDSYTGGGRFFPSLGLDGNATVPPAPMIPMVKRLMTDMELHKLMSDVAAELNDAIINKRTSKKLNAGIISDKRGYGTVMSRLRKLLIAHAKLELYTEGSPESAAAWSEFTEKRDLLKSTVESRSASTSRPVLRDENPVDDAGSVVSHGTTAAQQAADSAAEGFATKIRIFRVNGANPARIQRVVMQDTSLYELEMCEIAVSVVVQQLLSGILVTRVGVMVVFPASELAKVNKLKS